MEKELKEVLIQKDYKKAIYETIRFLKNMDRDKIENWISYTNILIYKEADEKYYKNYIKPLSIKLLKEFPDLIDYIQQVCLINEVLESLYVKLERDFEPYKNGCMLFAVYIITCNYEEFLHDLNVKLNNYKNDRQIENIMNVYQTNVDRAINSLNRMIRKIYIEKDSVFNNNSAEDFKQFIEKVKKESESDFINIMCKLNSVEDVLDMVKSKEARIISYADDEFQLDYTFNRIAKYDIPKMRLKNFDNSNFRKYAKNVSKDFKLLEVKDILQFVEISEDKFKLKIDLLSDEFLINIKTILIDSLRFTEFILFENYIDINKMNDNVIIKGKTMRFTFDDLLYFHMAILGMANYYYIAEDVFITETKKHSITSVINIDKSNLKTYIIAVCRYCLDKIIEDDVADELIDYYTYGAYGICDVFCTPLLQCREQYIIVPSVVMVTNFGRVFIEHINKLEIDFKKGDIFEENFKIMLREHDFKVYSPKKPQLDFTTQKGHIGDIDILAIKDDYIFCAQLKNKPMPLEQQEFTNYNRKLLKALKQLKYVNEYLNENPKKILDYYGIEDLRVFKIICFSVSNSFYRSGECIDGIYTTDINALNVLFDSGKITIKEGDKKITKYLRKDDKVIPEELENFLKNPYFMWDGVYL